MCRNVPGSAVSVQDTSKLHTHLVRERIINKRTQKMARTGYLSKSPWSGIISV